MTSPPPSRAEAGRATLLIALAACGFGAIAIPVTLAEATGAPLLTLLAGRYIIGAVVLGSLALAGGSLILDRTTLGITAVAGLGQVAVSIISLSALKYIPAATLAFLFYTYPAWIAIIA